MTTLQSTTLHLTILQLHFIDIQNDHAVCCSHMFTPDAHNILRTQERQLGQILIWQMGAVCWHLVCY